MLCGVRTCSACGYFVYFFSCFCLSFPVFVLLSFLRVYVLGLHLPSDYFSILLLAPPFNKVSFYLSQKKKKKSLILFHNFGAFTS